MSMVAFYDAVSNWPTIEPHTRDLEFVRILHHDFSRFTLGRYGMPYPSPSRPYPADWEDLAGPDEDDGPYLGPPGEYMRYVRKLACYWLVGANLKLATLILPERPWSIVMSSLHSTVWDGEELLFDLMGQALYGSADKAFSYACVGLSRLLDPGIYLEVKPAPRDERLSYRRYIQLSRANGGAQQRSN
jgi:hypothetical protein